MFHYIQNNEDAYNLFLIFQRVMEEEKTREKPCSLEDLYKKVDYEYYITYVMHHEANQIEMDDVSCGSFACEYDGEDGYDN